MDCKYTFLILKKSWTVKKMYTQLKYYTATTVYIVISHNDKYHSLYVIEINFEFFFERNVRIYHLFYTRIL